MGEFRLDQATYAKLSATMAQLGIAVRSFPSDIVLVGVREIGRVCAENDATDGGDPRVAKVCADTAEKRALIEEVAKALTAARVLIENAMETYKEAAASFDPKKQEAAGLYVPQAAGRITLTDKD